MEYPAIQICDNSHLQQHGSNLWEINPGSEVIIIVGAMFDTFLGLQGQVNVPNDVSNYCHVQKEYHKCGSLVGKLFQLDCFVCYKKQYQQY